MAPLKEIVLLLSHTAQGCNWWSPCEEILGEGLLKTSWAGHSRHDPLCNVTHKIIEEIWLWKRSWEAP